MFELFKVHVSNGNKPDGIVLILSQFNNSRIYSLSNGQVQNIIDPKFNAGVMDHILLHGT